LVNVSVKTLGSRRKLFEDFSVPVRSELLSHGETSLADLIANVVRHELHSYQERQQQRQFLKVLTHAELTAGRRAGKIESGGVELHAGSVNETQAIATALQAFEDGLFYCVVDDTQIEHLDQQVNISQDSRLTFIKLTMLAGG